MRKMKIKLSSISLLLIFLLSVNSFQAPQRKLFSTSLMVSRIPEISRQSFLASSSGIIGLLLIPQQAEAAERQSLDNLLYNLMRVREATFQESRLINTGKFKDVQRANVKLAVKFIVNNYRLSDSIVQASAYIEDSSKRVAAGDVGQSAVQDLLTILEYFDSSDVQNLKVGSQGMGGKEALVTQGLQSARSNIDAFLEYFPKDKVDAARQRVVEENQLNYKEWDKNLGDIVNLPPGVGV